MVPLIVIKLTQIATQEQKGTAPGCFWKLLKKHCWACYWNKLVYYLLLCLKVIPIFYSLLPANSDTLHYCLYYFSSHHTKVVIVSFLLGILSLHMNSVWTSSVKLPAGVFVLLPINASKLQANTFGSTKDERRNFRNPFWAVGDLGRNLYLTSMLLTSFLSTKLKRHIFIGQKIPI